MSLEKSPFNFFDFCHKKEFSLVLGRTKPVLVPKIDLCETEFNFDFGEFKFRVSGGENFSFIIPFYFKNNLTNKFLRFLEDLIDTTNPLIFYIFYKGKEYFIYTEPLNSADIRFLVSDTGELYEKERGGKILHYSYAESKVEIDIRIKKKRLIKDFYEALLLTFSKYKNMHYFEKPFIEFENTEYSSSEIENYILKEFM